MFEGVKNHARGLERRIIGGFSEVDQDGAWVVEEPYQRANEQDVGDLFDFVKPSGVIKGLGLNKRSKS